MRKHKKPISFLRWHYPNQVYGSKRALPLSPFELPGFMCLFYHRKTRMSTNF